MSLRNAAVSATLEVLLLAGVPFLLYWGYQSLRHKRSFREVARRAGLQLGEKRYLLYSLACAMAGVVVLLVLSPRLDPFTRPGAAQRQFVGMGLSFSTLAVAFLSGAVQTAFAEELLFRGLIAGSLSRRLPLVWADLIQALIFFAPHLLVLRFAPELWGVLLTVLAGALLFGWVRMKSGSILGSWLMHATGNVTIALMVAFRTAAG